MSDGTDTPLSRRNRKSTPEAWIQRGKEIWSYFRDDDSPRQQSRQQLRQQTGSIARTDTRTHKSMSREAWIQRGKEIWSHFRDDNPPRQQLNSIDYTVTVINPIVIRHDLNPDPKYWENKMLEGSYVTSVPAEPRLIRRTASQPVPMQPVPRQPVPMYRSKTSQLAARLGLIPNADASCAQKSTPRKLFVDSPGDKQGHNARRTTTTTELGSTVVEGRKWPVVDESIAESKAVVTEEQLRPKKRRLIWPGTLLDDSADFHEISQTPCAGLEATSLLSHSDENRNHRIDPVDTFGRSNVVNNETNEYLANSSSAGSNSFDVSFIMENTLLFIY